MVTIDSGIEATTQLSDVPPHRWRELMDVRRLFLKIELAKDCRRLVEFVEDAEEMFHPLGFTSPQEMIETGLGLQLKEVEIAVGWLKLRRPDWAVPYAEALILGKQEHGIPGGKPGPGRGHKTDANNVRLSKSPCSEAYTLARLDRDGYTDLAAQVRAKTLSANAAAIQAGFRKKPTELDKLRRAWARASAEERATFLREVTA